MTVIVHIKMPLIDWPTSSSSSFFVCFVYSTISFKRGDGNGVQTQATTTSLSFFLLGWKKERRRKSTLNIVNIHTRSAVHGATHPSWRCTWTTEWAKSSWNGEKVSCSLLSFLPSLLATFFFVFVFVFVRLLWCLQLATNTDKFIQAMNVRILAPTTLRNILLFSCWQLSSSSSSSSLSDTAVCKNIRREKSF